MPSKAIVLAFGFSRRSLSKLAKSLSETILVDATHEDCFFNSEKLAEFDETCPREGSHLTVYG